MFARIPFVALLLMSLLFAGLTLPQARAAGECGEMMCVKACCPMKACCDSGQQQAPSTPESAAPRPDLQLVAPGFQVFVRVDVTPGKVMEFHHGR